MFNNLGGADENFGGHNNGLGKLSGIPRVLSPPTPAQNARQGSRHKHDGENAGNIPMINFDILLCKCLLTADLTIFIISLKY